MINRTYGLTQDEAVAVLSAARRLLIGLKHEQPDYEPPLDAWTCALYERWGLHDRQVVAAYKPAGELSDAQEDADNLLGLENEITQECERYTKGY